MIPAAFVIVANLPLNPSGKLDRQALPRLDPRNYAVVAPSEIPRPGIEDALARLWREVLGVDHVSRDQNFFEAGGHSLLLIRLLARARATIDPDIDIIRLFEFPTIASLAANLANRRAQDSARQAGSTLIATQMREGYRRLQGQRSKRRVLDDQTLSID
jgi:aryl carrier-like protein